jgi:hypothetical protein
MTIYERQKMFRPSVTLTLGLALSASVATSASAKPRDDKDRDPNKVVCEKQEVLGSRLATRRVCMTRAEWTEKRRADRDMVQKSQLGVRQDNP